MSEDRIPVDVDTELIALAMHKLSIDNTNVVDVLTDCNIYLNKLNHSDLLKSANLMDLNLIFDCLNTTDQAQIESSCLLIKKLLPALSPNYAFKKYSACIERALHHPNDTVKSTILSEMDKLLTIDKGVDVTVDLGCTIIDCLESNDLSVSYNAIKCLKHFGCIETLRSSTLVSKFEKLMKMDSKIRSRVYDVIIYWSMSMDNLRILSSTNLYSNLVADISNPDIMMQMVTIQMLIPLSVTEYGFDFLCCIGVINGLYNLLSSNPTELDDPSVVILQPIVLEFFIKLIQGKPQLILTFPKVLAVVYEVLKDGNDESFVGVATNSITFLASSWDCKNALNLPVSSLDCDIQGKVELDIWSLLIQALSQIVYGHRTNIRAGAIQAITKIIQVEDGEFSSKNEMIEHTKNWYKQIKNNPIKNIVHSACVYPFPDVKQAGFEMYQTLAVQPWGQEEISTIPNLLDILFQNDQSESMEIILLKKSIIQTLKESSILKREIAMRIKTYESSENNHSNTSSSGIGLSVEDMAMQ